jgi:hypothetical protein
MEVQASRTTSRRPDRKPSGFSPCYGPAFVPRYVANLTGELSAMDNHEQTIPLLRGAVAEPFLVVSEIADHGTPHSRIAIWDWARHLRTEYPLWAFQPHAYAALTKAELPTTYPLRTLVRSIADDEGLQELSGQLPSLDAHGWLTMVVDSRRCGLFRDEGGSWVSDSVEEVDGQFRFYGTFGIGFPQVLNGPVLAYYEPDTEYTIGGYISPYEDIGVQLVNLVEDREAAPAGSAERVGAQKRLDEFLEELGNRVRGRPTVLRDSAAKRIFEEGRELNALLWDALGTEVPVAETTRRVLASQGVEPSEMLGWATRLALPNFSDVELRALRRRIRETRHRPPEAVAFADEFTVQLLAHRLRTPVATIARKVMYGRDAELVQASGDACMVCGRKHTSD